MTSEEKLLLLKDISARLIYGVMCSIKGHEEKYWDSILQRYVTNSIDKPVRITGISIDNDCIYLDSLGISEVYGSDNFGGLKPYLRAMSSMTEDEEYEYNTAIDKGVEPERIIDWLNAHHFDYRGLIELGLALEAPEGMYK